MKTRRIFFIIAICFLSAGISACTASNAQTGPKREVRSYSNRTIKFDYIPELYFTNDSGDIEVYTWDKYELKIEMTKRVRGTGENEALLKKTNDFIICIREDEKKIIFESDYKGKVKNPADRGLDLKIFIPKKTRIMSYKLGTGSIRILDDIKGMLDMRLDAVNVVINKFDGTLSIKGRMGNININSGMLKGNNSVIEDMGNISIKSVFDANGNYNFRTGIGNIDLMLPKDSKVGSDLLSPLIKVYSGMGQISIKKY